MEILFVASLDAILMTKALIRLCGCAGWSTPLLFASTEDRFSRVEANLTELSLSFVDGVLVFTQMNQRKHTSTLSRRWFVSACMCLLINRVKMSEAFFLFTCPFISLSLINFSRKSIIWVKELRY